MGIAEAVTILASVAGALFTWWRGSKADRQRQAVDAARSTIRWVVDRVVRELEATARKRLGAVLTPQDARDLLETAVKRVLAMLEPQRKKLEKALNLPDLEDLIRGEIEVALVDVKHDKITTAALAKAP